MFFGCQSNNCIVSVVVCHNLKPASISASQILKKLQTLLHTAFGKNTHSLFSISPWELFMIYAKFSANVRDETSIPSTSKLNIHCCCNFDVIFKHLQIMGFTVED